MAPRPEDFVLCNPGAAMAKPKRTMATSGLLQHNQLRTCEGKARHIDQYLTLPTHGPVRSSHDATMHNKYGRGNMSVAVNGVKSGNGAATSSSTAAGAHAGSQVRANSESAVNMRRPGWNNPEERLTESMIKKEGAWGEAPIHAGPRGHALRHVEDYAHVADDPAHLKYMAVHQKSVNACSGTFNYPHQFDPDKEGLPMYPPEHGARFSEKAPGLPSNYVKPCVNTSATHYNYFASNPDLYENDQRQFNFFMERQHKFNKEMKRLIDNSANSYAKEYYVHGSTKPLGRMYFDNKSRVPKFKLTDAMCKDILPEGYVRKEYDFWR